MSHKVRSPVNKRCVPDSPVRQCLRKLIQRLIRVERCILREHVRDIDLLHPRDDLRKLKAEAVFIPADSLYGVLEVASILVSNKVEAPI